MEADLYQQPSSGSLACGRGVLVELEEIAGVVIQQVGFLGLCQVCGHPYGQLAFPIELALLLQFRADGVGDPGAFGVCWADDKSGFLVVITFLFGDRRKVGIGKGLVTLAVLDFLHPAEPIQLGKARGSVALRECLRGFEVVSRPVRS